MPLSWNEIKTRAFAFSKEWQDETSEDAEAKSFWDDFFSVFGITRRRVASFEVHVKELGDKDGYIDLFWKGVLVVEHKSRGKNLEKAYSQALDYFSGIAERDLPKYVIVSDFARFRLYNLEENQQHDFDLKDLHKNVHLFSFIAGYQTHKIQEQDPVNIRAAEQMGKLHDQMKDAGYSGHPLELYMVRLLFCLFAEDTGIFDRQQFKEYIEQRTSEDGSDLGHHLSTLFQVLNTPHEKRLKNLDEQLAAFNYINGKLFEEMLPSAGFDSAMRQELLNCCALNWSRISPAIFGSLFQSIMDKQARRNLGAHYTSEENILKLIKPLFLDGLWEEFEKIKNNKNKLLEFHQRLRRLNFLDPACGCGNFLVIAYRELRLLELEILRASKIYQSEIYIHKLINLNVDQFFGIESEEFPAQIAQVALWLMDHQMNLLVSEEFGLYFARIPLETSAKIVCGNALEIDWEEVIPVRHVSYIMGNPPFSGAMVMSDQARADVDFVFQDLKGSGVLDYVACWYWLAAKFIYGTSIEVGFVSTNSICQGEQVGLLWQPILDRFKCRINFAHRTFKWNNEAKGKAAVHCVIIGFATHDAPVKIIYDYDTVNGKLHAIKAKNINPFLIDAPNVLLVNRKEPICQVPAMRFGSMPRDGGHFIFTEQERNDFLKKEPNAKKWIRPYTGAQEFINGYIRYCLWLNDIKPDELSKLHEVIKRVELVKEFRLASKAAATRRFARTSSLFCQIAQPKTDYLLVPRVSSERRKYIPIGFVNANVIANDQVLTVEDASFFHFGIISSSMHMAWVSYVCGRLKSDYRYSKDIVYNNFPWPENPTEKQKQAIEAAAQTVIDIRAQFPDSSLADLYDPLTMPPDLLNAHQQLDKSVDAVYGKTNFQTEDQRMAFLFELYQKYTSLFPPEKKRRSGC
ncbi:MAG: DNA methyltransferase [Smithella sp.]